LECSVEKSRPPVERPEGFLDYWIAGYVVDPLQAHDCVPDIFHVWRIIIVVSLTRRHCNEVLAMALREEAFRRSMLI
jgi:hypothetical protein